MSKPWVIEKYDTPWQYITIDNFFDDYHWDYIVNNIVADRKKYLSKFKSQFGKNKDNQLTYGEFDRVVNRFDRFYSYLPHNDSLLLSYFRENLTEEFFKDTFDSWRGHTKMKNYLHLKYNYKQFSTCGIHEDFLDKVFSTIVYVSPEHETGTLIYNEKQEFDHVVTWKPNRAFIFAPLDNITWHDYIQTTANSQRITIDFLNVREGADIDLPIYSKSVYND